MKLAFLGTPDIAVATLRGLHDAGHEIDVVVTGADARRGRGTTTTPSPVKALATELGLRVEHDPDVLLESDAPLAVVVAFGRILKPHLLAHMPMVNLHFSLLPRWRGAAPVERAILAGDVETGVCVMAVEEGLDTGGVYARATTPVADKTLAELWDELSRVGTELLVDWLPTAFGDGVLVEPEPQVGEVTYAAKLTTDDRRVDLDAPATRCMAVVRLGNAWTVVDGVRLKIREARIGADGAFEMVTVVPEGGRPMAYADWLRGRSS
ncbi:MAG: methionyl-tRNA formyltransferase [Acidimicrobiales bacterium]